jgi:hypothetical protein
MSVVFQIILYTVNIGTNEVNPDPNSPCDLSDNGLNSNAISNANDKDDSNNDDGDDDGDAVDDPTVEAHVDLAKIACKYLFD